MLQNPTVGIKHAALHLPAFAQAITSFTTQHTHAYQLTASLVASSALAWLQAKPSRSLEDGKWEMGDGRSRDANTEGSFETRSAAAADKTEFIPAAQPKLPLPISHFPIPICLHTVLHTHRAGHLG